MPWLVLVCDLMCLSRLVGECGHGLGGNIRRFLMLKVSRIVEDTEGKKGHEAEAVQV